MGSSETSVIQQDLIIRDSVLQSAKTIFTQSYGIKNNNIYIYILVTGLFSAGMEAVLIQMPAKQSSYQDTINMLFKLSLWKRYKFICTQKSAIHKAAIKLWRWIAAFKCCATHLPQTVDTQQVNAEKILSVQPSTISCHNFAQQKKFLSLPSFGVAMCIEVPLEKPL